MAAAVKRGLLLLLSCALLITGGELVFQQSKFAFLQAPTAQQSGSSLNLKIIQGQYSDLQGAFPVGSVENLSFQREGKEAFSLLLASYKDKLNHDRRAILYPKDKMGAGLMPSPTGLRQSTWEDAVSAIRNNTTEDALFLGWWDDSQRIHFLGGRESWVSNPSAETFVSPFWKNFNDKLLAVIPSERERLISLARWLTMDCDKALTEMRAFFGSSQPIYILVTNDLVHRIGEMADYGGDTLTLTAKIFPVNDNLHGDIARIKQWAAEEGGGNYLVQKEGANYRVWIIPKNAVSTKNTLLIRLLPFVHSLKQLPDHTQLVYQSQWGGYLSIYKLNF